MASSLTSSTRRFRLPTEPDLLSNVDVQPTVHPMGRGAATAPEHGYTLVQAQIVFTIEVGHGTVLPTWFAPIMSNAITAVPADASPRLFQVLETTAKLLAHTVRRDTPAPQVKVQREAVEVMWSGPHGRFAKLRVPSTQRYELWAEEGKQPESKPVDRLSLLAHALLEFDPIKTAEEYVRNLLSPKEGDPLTTKEIANKTIAVLRDLRVKAPGLPVPTIAPGPDHVVGMTWQDAEQHISIEVFPGGTLELFREDLTSASGKPDLVENATEVPEAFVRHLRRFAKKA